MSVQSFGRFLLTKAKSPGPIGDLAQAATNDPKFPRDGTPQDISKLLNRNQAPTEFHDALDEAETEWRSLN